MLLGIECANNTTNNNIKVEEEAPIATTSI
jgi:hypothetical protein